MTTRDHELIRAWAEARGGHPARTSQPGGGPVLRLDFRAADENLAEASWEPFFRVFDRQQLASSIRSGRMTAASAGSISSSAR